MKQFNNNRWLRKSRLVLAGVAMLVLWGMLFVSLGCSRQTTDEAERELLIYCGITMIKPMTEIAELIEAQYPCRITITKGGSGNLLKSIRVNQVGDLYLPGSESYIATCLKDGTVTERVHVGHNKAALMVQKGNPRGITADLNNLLRDDYYVVIGNPKSGSIGRETQKILESKGIFNRVTANARHLTTDSKDLIKVLADKEADLVVNWYATATWPENEPYVDALPIDSRFAKPKNLVLGLLKYSRYPEIAREFMALAASAEGRAIFKKYGLYHDE